jgi:hypothetical protein
MNSLIGLQLKTRLLKVELDKHFIRASLRHSTEGQRTLDHHRTNKIPCTPR